MDNKLIVNWDEYNKTVEELAIQVHDSGFKVDLLVGIMRGGAPIIDVLSRIFKIKCAYMAVESYSGEKIENEQGQIIFSRELSSTAHTLGGNILLCDDLSDTGVTLNKSIEWLQNYRPMRENIKEIRTAVLWKKSQSTFEPDYCANRLKDSPWIIQPFEKYEEIRIEDIKKTTRVF